MKTLKKSDSVAIVFGEWFDKTYGNTYYDATVHINSEVHEIPYQYGYNHGDKQAIDESLAACGYRVRTNKKNPHSSYRHIISVCSNKLKRELHK